MQLRADALRFVLAQGLPAVIEVAGPSMEPTIARGTKVHVAGLPDGAALSPGDIVLLATSADVLLLHRVMAVFEEGGARFIVHQGDASGSTFGITARRDVIGRMTGFVNDSVNDSVAAARAVPTPEHLDATARALYQRRRLACAAFVAARRLASTLRLSERPLVRRCAQVYRRLARSVAG